MFLFDIRSFGLRIALSNLCFNLAYRFASLTSARR